MIPSSGTSAAHALPWLSDISSPPTRNRNPGRYVWEPLDAAARVVAHLEHCVDTVLTKVVDVPRLEVRAGRQRSRCHVHGIPAVVVEDNKLGRAAGEQPLTRGSDVGFQPRLSRLPVLRQTPEDLTHAPELRRALHVHADRNEHSVAS